MYIAYKAEEEFRLLECVDIDDGREYIKSYYGGGIRFCQANLTDEEVNEWFEMGYESDSSRKYLKNNKKYVT